MITIACGSKYGKGLTPNMRIYLDNYLLEEYTGRASLATDGQDILLMSALLSGWLLVYSKDHSAVQGGTNICSRFTNFIFKPLQFVIHKLFNDKTG